MQLNEDISSTRYQLQALDKTGFTVNKTLYKNSIIITPDTLISPWQCHDYTDINEAAIEPLLELNIEVVIFGTGANTKLISQHQLMPLVEKNIGIECMSTPAATRTFVALASEGRAVAAALILQQG